MKIKILIIRFSSIGDIVLCSPVIRCIKQQKKDVELHLLTKKEFLPIVKNNPHIDKIHLLDNNFSELKQKLKDEFFDFIIDLHKNLRSKNLINKLKIASLSFDKLNYKKWLVVNFKIDKLPDIHIVDRYFEAVKVFDIYNDNKGLNYFITEEEKVDISKFFDKKQEKFIAIVVGAKHYTKTFPAEKIISILKKVNLPAVLLGGKTDIDKAEKIEASVELKNKNIVNFVGKLSINQSASVLQQSEFVLTNDTGMMHIASAFKKKIASVWGSTVPKFGMDPYLPDERSKIFEVKNLKCRPCSKIGFKECPKKHFDCMMKIDEKEIISFLMKS